MSKPTPTSDGASFAARESVGLPKVVLPTTTGAGVGPGARSAQSQIPVVSLRWQRRTGNQRLSIRTERSWLPLGSSIVVKRTAARSPSPSAAMAAAKSSMPSVALALTASTIAPRGTPAAPST